MRRHRLLYVTWDGPDVSYLEGLFLPILERISGFEIKTVQFTWGREPVPGVEAIPVMRRAGPFGPFATVLKAVPRIRKIARDVEADAVLARSTLPALAVALAHLDLPFIFDADGLPNDERVEISGLSPYSLQYRALEWIQNNAARNADVVLARTPYGRDVVATRSGAPKSKFHLVANARDETLFMPADKAQMRRKHGLPNVFTGIYAGSIGPQYRLDEIIKIMKSVRIQDPQACLIILSRTSHNYKEDWIINRAVQSDIVPEYLASADFGFSLRTVTPSMRAVSPIKTGEYLLCGLPVVGTPDIGNTKPLFEAGVFYPYDDRPEGASAWLLSKARNLSDLPRKIGVEHYSLSFAVKQYEAAIAAALGGR